MHDLPRHRARAGRGHEPDPEERIEIVEWPLSRLDYAIDECEDSKTLIGLMLLRDLRR